MSGERLPPADEAGAAAYLCASGPLDTPNGLRRAYFSYNHSFPYVEQVLRQALDYAESIEIPGT